MALVSLDGEAITAWADKHGLTGKSFAEIARHEKTHDLIGGYIEALNKELDPWEQVKRFAIIDRELSIEAGDLTPSMKLRRKVVLTRVRRPARGALHVIREAGRGCRFRRFLS